MNTLKKYLREPFNCLSHASATLMASVGFVVLLVIATGWIQYLAVILYGSSLLFLYTSSTIYHGIIKPQDIIKRFHQLDRAAIYVFIAGTTTPIALLSLPIGWGVSMLLLLWGIALIGIITTIWDVFTSRWVRTSIYLGMGWISLIFIEPLTNAFSWPALLWCIIGGVIYSLGAFIYALEWPRLHAKHFGAHELWHVMVILGSSSHYVFISVYIL